MIRKVIHLYILYYTLNQRYCRYHRQQRLLRNHNNNNNNNNNNFDPFVIFKVLFMIAILWSRVQQSQQSSSNHNRHRRLNDNHDTNNNDDDDDDSMDVIWTLQLYGALFLVVLFFMYRTGQLIFLYLFYYKYRIPQRVLLQNNRNNNNNTHHMITADEIWNEHLLAVTEQEQQRQLQQQQQQNNHHHPPPGPGGVRGANHNHNPIEQLLHRVRHRLEWLLVHDWIRGEPIANAAAVAVVDAAAEHRNVGDMDAPQPHNPNTNPPTNNETTTELQQHISPMTKFVRMILTTIQDIIIFLVTFILSILPIWRNIDPEALFRGFQQERQQREPRDNENQDDQDNANEHGIPIVQPPIDPAE